MLKDILAQAWEAMLYNRRRTCHHHDRHGLGHRHRRPAARLRRRLLARARDHLRRVGHQHHRLLPRQDVRSRPAATKPASRSVSLSTTSTASPQFCPKSPTSRPPSIRRPRAKRPAHLYLDRHRLRPAYADIIKLTPDQGRFFNGAEDQQRAHVCVLGSDAKTKLFSGGWAPGETIRINGVTLHRRRHSRTQNAGGQRRHQSHRLHPLQHHERPERHHLPRRCLDQLSRRLRN